MFNHNGLLALQYINLKFSWLGSQTSLYYNYAIAVDNVLDCVKEVLKYGTLAQQLISFCQISCNF